MTFALALDPTSPSTVYAGTAGGGVFKSANGGGSWSAANTGLPTESVVGALALDPTNPSRVYAGTGGGVFKSTDGGGSWRAVNFGLTTPRVAALALDPTNPTRLYAGTIGGGVYVLEPLSPCGNAPRPDCKMQIDPPKGGLLLADAMSDSADLLTWRWTNGTATAKAEFYDPTLTTDHVLCVYDWTAGTPRRVLEANAPADGRCRHQPCWQATKPGFTYADPAGTSDGLRKVDLDEGLTPGTAEITVRAQGANVPLPMLPLHQSPKVTVRVSNSFGSCWGAEYHTAIRNTARAFMAGRPTP